MTKPTLDPHSAQELSKRLDYEFKDISILELACIHKSFGNEHRANSPVATRDNERLEFLGDAVLDLIVSQLLLESFPGSSEGDLSKLRAGLVNERCLAKIARQIGIGDFLLLGKGEENTGGRNKDSILASTFEAVVAAIYIDGGFPAAEKWVLSQFSERVRMAPVQDGLQDYKTRLQELAQARYKTAPRYEVLEATGPDHDKTFLIQLSIAGNVITQASGKSKKEAEQSAAKIALEQEAGKGKAPA